MLSVLEMLHCVAVRCVALYVKNANKHTDKVNILYSSALIYYLSEQEKTEHAEVG